MANLVNQMLLEEIRGDLRRMGSCIVLSFDKLSVANADDIRAKLREAGVELKVVKNRLALKAFDEMGIDLAQAFRGKCGVVIAPEERAITAAKIVRDAYRRSKQPPLVVSGGVIEGEAIVGPAVDTIADMPDKDTVRAQLLAAISGPARALASCLQAAGPAGLARAVRARTEKEQP